MIGLGAGGAESRAAQGLPPKITDPGTLRRLALLFVGRDTGAPKDPGATISTDPALAQGGGRDACSG